MSTSVEESKAADDPGALAEIALQRATAQAEEGDFAAVLTTLEGFEDSTRSITAKAKRRTLLAAAELRRGVALVNMGRPADAVAHLEHAKSLKPPDDERPALHLQLAIALVGQGQLPVALDELRAGAEVAQGPELSLTHLWTGIALVKSDDPSGALLELEAARTSQPEGVTWPLLPLYTALAFGATRDLEKALEEATAAEHLQSNPYLRALSIVLQASSLVGLGRSGALDCLQRIGLADVKDTDLAEVVAAWVPELLLEARRVDDASHALEAADGIGLDWRASPRLVAVRANVRILQGRIDDALEALDRAEELDPTLRLLLEGRKAGILLTAGQGDRAFQLYGSIADVEPGEDAAAADLLAVGAARVTLGRAAEAGPMLEEAVRKDPAVASMPDYQFASLGMALALGRFEEAKGIAEKLQEGSPGGAVQVMLGFALEGEGDADAAAEAFRRAATAPEDDPITRLNSFVAWIHLAIAEGARGRLDEANEAVAEAQRRMDADPAAVSAPLRYQFEAARALVELKSGHGDQAVEHARAALKLAPDLGIRGAVASASLLLGRLLAAENRQEEALSAFRRSIDEDQDNPDAWMGLGRAHLALQEPSEALAAFESAAQHAGEPAASFEAAMAQGRALTDLLQHEQAVSRFRAALDLRPDNSSVWRSLGAAYASLGRNTAAYQAFERGWRLDAPPRSAELAIGASAALLSDRRDQEAVDFLDRAEPTTAPDRRIDFNRGVALYRLRRVPEAVESWTRAGSGAHGIERATELAQQLRARPSDPTSWFDYWFGKGTTGARKAGGAVLILVLAAVLVPSLVAPAHVSWLGWLSDSTSWPRVLAPALVAIGLLILPSVNSLKVGPVAVEPREAGAHVEVPGPTVDAIIHDVMKSSSIAALPLPGAPAGTVTGEFAEVSLTVLPVAH